MEDADVEGEIVLRQQFEPFDEVGPQAEFRIGLGLDQPPDGAQDPVPRSCSSSASIALPLLERQRRDHAGEARIGTRQLRHPCRLVKMLRIIDVDLDEDELLDLTGAAAAGEIAPAGPGG